MRNQIKRITAITLFLLLCLSLFVMPVNADGPTKSKYYSTVSTTVSVSSGVLNIYNSYIVNSNTGFTDVEIHTYAERRVFGLFWFKVDNGQPNNTWVDTSVSRNYGKTYSLTLPHTGTYRVTAEYIFNGSNGSESITRQQTVSYS